MIYISNMLMLTPIHYEKKNSVSRKIENNGQHLFSLACFFCLQIDYPLLSVYYVCLELVLSATIKIKLSQSSSKHFHHLNSFVQYLSFGSQLTPFQHVNGIKNSFIFIDIYILK